MRGERRTERRANRASEAAGADLDDRTSKVIAATTRERNGADTKE
jgi:hypothetical protein